MTLTNVTKSVHFDLLHTIYIKSSELCTSSKINFDHGFSDTRRETIHWTRIPNDKQLVSIGLRANVEITTRVEDCLLCFLMFSKLFSNVLMTKLTLALTRNNHHDAKPDLSHPNDANRKDRIQNFDK